MELGMPTLIELPELSDCAELSRELGLQFIELNMNLPQYQTDQIRPGKLREITERYGVTYTLHLDENLDVSAFNPYVAEAYMRTVLESIALAKELHVPVLNMHLPRGVYFVMPGEKIFLFSVYLERYLRTMAEFRDRCERAVDGDGIKICVENTGGYTDFQVQALDLLLESPVFALTYDIGHDHGIGGRDGPIIMQREERLAHFHFHDVKGTQLHLPLGSGEVDVEKNFRLAQVHKSRIVLETKTVQGLRQSVEWFRRQYPGA